MLGLFIHNDPEAEAQKSYAHALCLSCHSAQRARFSFGLLTQGSCERKTPKF